MTTPSCVTAARTAFPRGLEQPAACYRFGSDALLLAAWAAQQGGAPQEVAELGCGCGAVLFALCLHPSSTPRPARLLGLDSEESLCLAARQNAHRLGLEGKCSFVCGDLREKAVLRACGLRRFDAVLANPPFATAGSGRPSPHRLRQRAMREDAGDCGRLQAARNAASLLTDFCRAAAALLRHHGRFFCIFPAADISRLLHGLRTAGLGLRAVLPVHARADAPAVRLLVEARMQAADDCRLLPPLVLHGCRREYGPDWTEQARRFCPWLAAGQESLPETSKG